MLAIIEYYFLFAGYICRSTFRFSKWFLTIRKIIHSLFVYEQLFTVVLPFLSYVPSFTLLFLSSVWILSAWMFPTSTFGIRNQILSYYIKLCAQSCWRNCFPIAEENKFAFTGWAKKSWHFVSLSIMARQIIANLLLVTLSAWQMAKWQNI